jgi:DNA-binding NarL/FixJ family response regulator
MGSGPPLFVLRTNWLCLHSLAVHFILHASAICIEADMARILIAEDNERFRTFLRTLLEQRHDDWSVCGVAKNGDEAVQKAIKLKPDVILLDIEMPKLDGLSACRLIREKVPTSEILILTVYQSLELARIAAESGAWGYISKTLISRDLIPAIETMIGRRPARGV